MYTLDASGLGVKEVLFSDVPFPLLRVGQDRQVSEFLRWLTVTHTKPWHAHHHTAGSGHLYQARFKSFPVESDEHLYTVLRYVERNPIRANLVERAEDWRWSSLARYAKGHDRGPPTAGGLADPSTGGLGLAGESGREQEGAGSIAAQRAARTAVRQRTVVPTDRPAPRPGIHPTPPRPSPKNASEALKTTPVPCSARCTSASKLHSRQATLTLTIAIT